jgi:hypothetical protein
MGVTMSQWKQLRAELRAELACLEEHGVTEEEIEAIMEQCGLPPRRSRLFNTGDRRHDLQAEETGR